MTAIDTVAEGTPTENLLRHISLWDDQEGLCYFCGIALAIPGSVPQTASNAATVDHLLPPALGGTNKRENLAWTCNKCNQAKGERTEEEYTKSLGDKWVDIYKTPRRTERMAVLDQLSYEQLLEAKAANANRMRDIATQLDEAKHKAVTGGVYSDSDWLHRALKAKRHLGSLDQAIALRITKVKRAFIEQRHKPSTPEAAALKARMKDARSQRFDRLFVEVSKEVLPPEDFEALKVETMRRQAANGTEVPP